MVLGTRCERSLYINALDIYIVVLYVVLLYYVCNFIASLSVSLGILPVRAILGVPHCIARGATITLTSQPHI